MLGAIPLSNIKSYVAIRQQTFSLAFIRSCGGRNHYLLYDIKCVHYIGGDVSYEDQHGFCLSAFPVP